MSPHWEPLGWLGPDRRPPALRAEFDAAAREVTARLCVALAALMGVVTALYWPTDRWLLPDDPESVAALARVRVGNLFVAAAVAGGLWASKRVRVVAVGWTGAWTVLQVGWAAWTLAQVEHGRHPWEQAGYLVPLAGCALFVPLGPRVAWTALLGATWSAPFLLRGGDGPRSAWLTSPLFETFAVVVGITIGHVMYALLRESWYTARELAERTAVIEASDAARRALFATLSHEVRTPLTLVTASLRRVPEAESTAGAVHTALRSARQIEWLLDQILEIARLEAPSSARRPSAVDVTTLVRQAVRGFAEAYASERRFSLDLPDSTLLIEGDATALSHLLHNLLSNAVKHSEPGGRVEVRVELEPDAWSLQVEDDGHGVAEQERELIFDLFARGSTAQSALRRGTGIGLALVRQAARAHGGEVALVPGTLGGACFRATMPRRSPASTADRATGELTSRELLRLSQAFDAPAVAPTNEPGPIDLLIVEDDPDLRAWLLTTLAPSLRVAAAISGTQAVALARAHPPDAVLTDLQMPDGDGWSVVRWFRASESLRHVPVLVVSAQVEAEVRVQALREGATDFVRKPFDPIELETKVLQAVARGREARQLAERESELRRELAALQRTAASVPADDPARRRLARELHDNLGQALASSALLLKASLLTADPDLARSRLGLVGELLATATDALRDALADLAPERLLRAGLPNLLRELAEPVGASGWSVQIELSAPAPSSPDTQLAVYRVAQQAVANAIQHGHPPLELRWTSSDDRDELLVRNQRAAGPAITTPTSSSGLHHLHQRAAAIGAQLSAGPEGAAWVVRLRVARS